MDPARQNTAYHETRHRGTPELPFDLHHIDRHHPRYVMPYHYHNAFEASRVLKGSLDLTLNERRYHLDAGDCLLIPGSIVHGGRPEGGDTLYECVVFPIDQILDIERPPYAFLRRLTRGQIMLDEKFTPKDSPDVVAAVNRLFDDLEEDKDSSGSVSMLAVGDVLKLFATIEREGDYRLYQDSMNSRYLRHLGKVSELFRYIYDNYQRQISLEDMAAVVGLSPKYFCRFFRELTGRRPMDYLNSFRVECAASRLMSSEESVNEVAYSCGFRDPCYFAKLFRRYRGVTPTLYRAGGGKSAALGSAETQKIA